VPKTSSTSRDKAIFVDQATDASVSSDADEGAVQEFAAASSDPAFGDRVHAGGPDVAEHDPDPGVGEDRMDAAVKFDPRSRIMSLTRSACPPRSIRRLRACWACEHERRRWLG
jgi:hypothetical protein